MACQSKSIPSHKLTGRYFGLACAARDAGDVVSADRYKLISDAYSMAAVSGSADARKAADRLAA